MIVIHVSGVGRIAGPFVPRKVATRLVRYPFMTSFDDIFLDLRHGGGQEIFKKKDDRLILLFHSQA